MSKLIVFLLMSCVLESTIDNGQEFSSEHPAQEGCMWDCDDPSSSPTEEEHPDSEMEESGVISVLASVDSLNIEANLGEEKIVLIRVKAKDDFTGTSVGIEIDKTDLNTKYISTDIPGSVSIKSGEEVMVSLKIKVDEMSPSFDSRNLKFKLIDVNSTKNDFEIPLKMSVKPHFKIMLLSGGVPHQNSLKKKFTCFGKEHASGVTIEVVNMTPDFNASSPFCLHTNGRLNHCKTANDSPDRLTETGQSYIAGTVAANSGRSSSDFYNHLNSSDNVGRKLKFNVDEGDYDNECSE